MPFASFQMATAQGDLGAPGKRRIVQVQILTIRYTKTKSVYSSLHHCLKFILARFSKTSSILIKCVAIARKQQTH